MTWDPQSGQWVAVPPQPAPNPFAGVPAGDFVRDGVAVALLVMSLFYPWDLRHDATDRIEVVLITLVSILSVGVTYLARANAFGPSFGVARAGQARLLANVPYLVMALAFLLADVAVGGGDGLYVGNGGVGAALALGLGGAVLAAQPRQAEQPSGGGGPAQELWRWAAVGLAALAAATVVVGLLVFLVNNELDVWSATEVAEVVVSLVVGVVLIGLPAVGLAGRREPWRLVLVLVGGSIIGLYLLGKGDSVGVVLVESLHRLPSGLPVWIAIAALAAAVPVRAAMRPEPAVWDSAARSLLVLATAAAGVQLLFWVLDAVNRDGMVAPIVVAVLTVIYTAVAAGGWLLLGPGASRVLGFGVAGVLLLLGAIRLIVASTRDYSVAAPADVFLAVVIPLGLAGFIGVAVARDARARGGAPTAASGAPYGQYAQYPAAPQYPGQQYPAAPQYPPPPPPPPPPVAPPA